MTPLQLGTIGVYLSAILSTTGFIGFVTLARFWRSHGGWLVFWDMLMVTWVLDLSSVSHLFDPPWFAWTRVATFAIGFPIILGWRAAIVFDLQLPGRWQAGRAYRKENTDGGKRP